MLTLPPAALCVAADSGIDHALALGLVPAYAIGDFDSVSAAGLAEVEQAGTVIERHLMAKDHTDLELALALAAELVPARIVVGGIGGGRSDHLLANVFALADARYAGPEIEAYLGTAKLTVIRGWCQLTGQVDAIVSLLPVHGDARGVTTTGLAYALHGETLRAGGSRGVSNVLVAPSAMVAVEEGTLIAVQPDAVAPVSELAGHDDGGAVPAGRSSRRDRGAASS